MMIANKDNDIYFARVKHLLSFTTNHEDFEKQEALGYIANYFKEQISETMGKIDETELISLSEDFYNFMKIHKNVKDGQEFTTAETKLLENAALRKHNKVISFYSKYQEFVKNHTQENMQEFDHYVSNLTFAVCTEHSLGNYGKLKDAFAEEIRAKLEQNLLSAGIEESVYKEIADKVEKYIKAYNFGYIISHDQYHLNTMDLHELATNDSPDSIKNKLVATIVDGIKEINNNERSKDTLINFAIGCVFDFVISIPESKRIKEYYSFTQFDDKQKAALSSSINNAKNIRVEDIHNTDKEKSEPHNIVNLCRNLQSIKRNETVIKQEIKNYLRQKLFADEHISRKDGISPESLNAIEGELDNLTENLFKHIKISKQFETGRTNDANSALQTLKPVKFETIVSHIYDINSTLNTKTMGATGDTNTIIPNYNQKVKYIIYDIQENTSLRDTKLKLLSDEMTQEFERRVKFSGKDKETQTNIKKQVTQAITNAIIENFSKFSATELERMNQKGVVQDIVNLLVDSLKPEKSKSVEQDKSVTIDEKRSKNAIKVIGQFVKACADTLYNKYVTKDKNVQPLQDFLNNNKSLILDSAKLGKEENQKLNTITEKIKEAGKSIKMESKAPSKNKGKWTARVRNNDQPNEHSR